MTTGRRLSFATGIVLVFLLVVDGIGRVAVSDAPPRHDGFVADTELGWALPQSRTINWRNRSATINSLALRSPEPESGAVDARLLIVGDSSVFGDGVRDTETLSSQLEGMLGGRPTVDVQNGGVPGFTCLQSQRLVDRVAERFVPDVLVVYNMHSDFRKTAIHDRVIVDHQLGPLSGTGIGRLLSYSVLRLRIQKGRSNLDVDTYAACLSSLVDDQEDRGGKVVFVVPITEPDFPDSPFYRAPDPDPPGMRLSDYRVAMEAVATATGSPLVDAPAAALAAGMTGGKALQDPVHPTAAGHAMIAGAIASALRATGWMPPGPGAP